MSEQKTVTDDDTAPGEQPDHPTADDDLATLLARRAHARPNRITWILLALLLVSVGFIGGAYANQKLGPTASTGLPGGFPAGSPNLPASGQVGATPFGDMTVGTVKLVDKQNLYVTTTSGDTVKVSVPDAVTVTAQREIDLADLASGDTVIIRGTTANDGTVTAESVSQGSLPGAPAPTNQGEN